MPDRRVISPDGLYAELFGVLMAWNGNTLESAFGDGTLAAVARGDLATAAAVVAAEHSAHDSKVYELVGPPLTAAQVAEQLGVQHRTIPITEYRARLLRDQTLPPFLPPMLTSIATSIRIRHGFLDAESADLARLIGRYQPAEDDRVDAGHPLERGGRRTELPTYRGESEIEDRGVQHLEKEHR